MSGASFDPSLRLAGIDRWRGGWMVAEWRQGALALWSAVEIRDAIERLEDCVAVGIDMPIALAVSGRREAESEVRAVLGSAARSVFTSPTRDAVEATSQSEATRRNRLHDGPGVSAQAFGLFASIRELRHALSTAGPTADRWHETHPETAFVLMADAASPDPNTTHGAPGGSDLAATDRAAVPGSDTSQVPDPRIASPLASKRTAQGVAQRLVLLRSVVPSLDGDLLAAPPKVPIDDVLDAGAALWSAERIATGRARRFGPPGRDDQGFAHGILV